MAATKQGKKPKCSAPNKNCGHSCKPKAAICADQRKKLLANAKKGGLKGQAAKNYVQARIDRYKSLVNSKSLSGVPLDINRTSTMGTKINTKKSTKDQLIDLGGSVWKESRVYMNDLAGFYGLELTRYNTGNVYSARLDGEKISNSEGNRILAKLNATKIWYDLGTDKFNYRSDHSAMAEAIIGEIKSKLT